MPDDLQKTGQARPKDTLRRMSAWPQMNPMLATGLVLAITCITGVFAWIQESRPDMTSNAFLARAEAWDPVALQGSSPGVIRQAVKITTKKITMKRLLYRDAQGKRKPLEQDLTPDEHLLMQRMAEADISWDAPLSAVSYKRWYDAQRACKDQVHRSNGDSLVLTATAPEGVVMAQSLTVRDTDFHPIRRTVSFRDGETVEIAELDYSVLPWTPQVSSLFQTRGGISNAGSTGHQPALIPLPPLTLTEEQLSEVELRTRLTLDRLHADTGEQIEVARGTYGIEVRGIVETEKRRKELETQLHMLPNVTTFLSSIDGMKAKPLQSDALSSVNVIEMQTRATALETYYLAHGRNVAPLGDLSRKLYNCAFAINLESKAIDELERRFASKGEMSAVASATLSDLLFTHKRKLLDVLGDEEEMLVNAQIKTAPLKGVTSANQTDLALASQAERNLVLIRELVMGNSENNLPAEAIASELAAALSDLKLKAHEVQVVSRNFTKLDKSK